MTTDYEAVRSEFFRTHFVRSIYKTGHGDCPGCFQFVFTVMYSSFLQSSTLSVKFVKNNDDDTLCWFLLSSTRTIIYVVYMDAVFTL